MYEIVFSGKSASLNFKQENCLTLATKRAEELGTLFSVTKPKHAGIVTIRELGLSAVFRQNA